MGQLQTFVAYSTLPIQVNLAVILGKPIIPLQMEKMSWPPPGAMGPIFGEYIFVRFFQRSGEETKDERFWPEAKFTELLIQLRYTIAPDTSLITEGFKLLRSFAFFDGRSQQWLLI